MKISEVRECSFYWTLNSVAVELAPDYGLSKPGRRTSLISWRQISVISGKFRDRSLRRLTVFSFLSVSRHF
jgi:hypothetical protein